MICTVTEFNTYTQNYEDSTEVVAQKESVLNSAQEQVADYLGYDPESKSHTDYISGIGNNRLYLKAQPITAVSSVVIDGVTLDSSAYDIMRDYLRLKDGVWAKGVENVLVTYTAGYSSSNMPDTIKMVVLQIASLMQAEEGGNIGITGKSFSESSRTFINYTNFDKWLKKLDGLRQVRF